MQNYCPRLLLAWVSCAALLTGCAGLVAKKVPLPQRACGVDKQNGFRYYLSRPYLVVGERILVDQDIRAGVLVRKKSKGDNNKKEFAVRVVTPDGDVAHCDLQGNAFPITIDDLDDWKVVTIGSDNPTATGMIGDEGSVLMNTGFRQHHNASGLSPLSGASGFAPTYLGREYPNSPPEFVFDTAGAESDVKEGSPSFQIAYLPDFEEQMVVRHKNFLAKGKFTLQFRDGWQLDSVQGNFDSTDVAVQILKTLQTAIDEAAAYEEERLKQMAKLRNASKDVAEKEKLGAKQAQRVAVVRRGYIPPGMYRLKKESERIGGFDPGMCGLLADMGLAVVSDTEVLLVAADQGTKGGKQVPEPKGENDEKGGNGSQPPPPTGDIPPVPPADPAPRLFSPR